MYYYKDVVEACCKITRKKEDFNARIDDLPIFYSTKYDPIKEQLVKDLNSKVELYIHVYKDFNKVFVYFSDDIEELIKISDDNKESIDILIDEFKKIGKVSKKEKGISIEIDYIKAAKYLYKDIYIYTNQKFLKSNQDKINKLCKEIKEENLIVGDVGGREYNLMIQKIIQRGDLVIIPDISILEGSVNIISFINEMLKKESDFIIEDYIGIVEDYLSVSGYYLDEKRIITFILEELQKIIEMDNKNYHNFKEKEIKVNEKINELEDSLENKSEYSEINNSKDFCVDDYIK